MTLPGEGLRRIAVAIAKREEFIDWSEPGVTRLFRYPKSVSEEEVTLIRDQIAAEDRNFNEVHERARLALKAHIKEAGGVGRWPTPAAYIDDLRYPVSIERGGKTIHGEYVVENGMLTVYGPGGSESTQQGNSSAETVAERLLFQMTASFERPAE